MHVVDTTHVAPVTRATLPVRSGSPSIGSKVVMDREGTLLVPIGSGELPFYSRYGVENFTVINIVISLENRFRATHSESSIRKTKKKLN